MAIAAVPGYLPSEDLASASPGLRFGLFLRVWTTRADQEQALQRMSNTKSKEGFALADAIKKQGFHTVLDALVDKGKIPRLWDKNDHAERDAWKDVVPLHPVDKATLAGLLERQTACAKALMGTRQLLRLEAEAIAPFTTGLGNEHPLENGFAFLNPYGLPYLPGSGVKGVIRQAARELASGDWGDATGWSTDPRYRLTIDRRQVALSMADVLFGRETEDRDTAHVRGALQFWDVYPALAGDRLAIDVMTPHQSHYYQEGQAHAGSVSPHESGKPNPITFLTVPPDSGFAFHVACDRSFLARVAPDLAEAERWQDLLRAAFAHAFDWLGFGAKTAVGYGAMRPTGADRPTSNRDGGPTPAAARATEQWTGVKVTYHPNNGELAVNHNGQQARAPRAVADRLRAGLTPEQQARLTGRTKVLAGCTVTVEKVGRAWQIVALDVPPAAA